MQENQGHKHFDYLRRLGSDYLDFDKCVEKECHLAYNKKNNSSTDTIACFIYFDIEISVMGSTEISIRSLHNRNFCTPHYRNFSVKQMKQAKA